MNKFRKFTSIEQLHTVVKYVMKYMKTESTFTYDAKIKLHGTNACIRFNTDGGVVAQKRTSDITVANDNFGFAQWVADNKDTLKGLRASIPFEGTIYVYGEWAGQGIQKSDAVSSTPKSFHAFCIVVVDEENPEGKMVYLVDDILKPFADAIDNFYIVPVFKQYTVNLFNEGVMETFKETIKADMDAIAKEDPYIKELFDVSGVGEGLVLYPTTSQSSLMFKIKTEAHDVNKSKKKEVVYVAPEVLENAKEFVEKYLTDNRLEQGVGEIGLDRRLTGKFIGWVCQDISKESRAEVEENELDWKMLANQITKQARVWYFKRLESDV